MEKITGIPLHEGVAEGSLFLYGPGRTDLSRYDGDEPWIIAAPTLTPAETVRFGGMPVAALAVTDATATSHTAILSRTMGWPAVSGVEIRSEWHGKRAIVDGTQGTLLLDPDREAFRAYRERKQEEERNRECLLRAYRGRKTIAAGGKQIRLYANISTPADVEAVLENDAEGIGNFKTEFMYLNARDYPSEEELFRAYREIVCRMDGRKVVIRTFDIGTDKIAPYFQLAREENPALGYRAVRIGLDRPELLETQLRAIIRASAFGPVSLLYPMIVSTDEVREIQKMVRNVMDTLKKQGISFDENMEQGIMIETPASVIMSFELAQMVDFFSIGTNDLTQYTLAADRQNSKLRHVYDPYHPAILRSIQYVVENAHQVGIWVEISGELGADLSQTGRLLACGMDAFAVPPSKILPLRKVICEMEADGKVIYEVESDAVPEPERRTGWQSKK